MKKYTNAPSDVSWTGSRIIEAIPPLLGKTALLIGSLNRGGTGILRKTLLELKKRFIWNDFTRPAIFSNAQWGTVSGGKG